MVKMLARALDKACANLEQISIMHCRCGDEGVEAFLVTLSCDSLVNLNQLILTNNCISKLWRQTNLCKYLAICLLWFSTRNSVLFSKISFVKKFLGGRNTLKNKRLGKFVASFL